MKPTLRTFLDLSTAHLTKTTREFLDNCATTMANRGSQNPMIDAPIVALADFGWWVFATPDGHPRWPVDLKACILLARGLGADYLLFDADAEVVDGLPVYEALEPEG